MINNGIVAAITTLGMGLWPRVSPAHGGGEWRSRTGVGELRRHLVGDGVTVRVRVSVGVIAAVIITIDITITVAAGVWVHG